MKKTIPTSIGNTLFYIEEDTYNELADYLTSIRVHFGSSPDNIEIVRDIEDRVREQFIDFTGGAEHKGERIITHDHVRKLIASMGRPEDFGDESMTTSSTTEKPPRKFYRDRDRAIIGGVSSGIATYFGIDPIIVRVIFIISLFVGGAGVIAYLILWIAVPEAKTSAQKLEMQGDPVNLRSMGEKAKEELKKKLSDLENNENLKSSGRRFGSFVGEAGKGVVTILGFMIGLGLKIASIAAMIGITAAFVIGLFNPETNAMGIPLHDIVSLPLYYLALTVAFFAGFIPFLFLNALGSVMMGKKTFLRGLPATILFGVWIAALVIGIATAASVADKTRAYVSNSPYFQEIVREVPLEAFEKLEVENAQDIKIIAGQTFGAKIRGNEADIENIVFDQDGSRSLRIYRDSGWRPCFFCKRLSTQIELTVAGPVSFIKSANASRIDSYIDFENLEIVLENASLLMLTGKAESLKGTLENASKLEAENMRAQTVDLDLRNASKADFYAEQKLIFRAKNASKGVQHGPANIENSATDNGSKLESRR